MPNREEFTEMIATTFTSLYDLVRLRTDPLAELLITDTTLSPKERAWQLHQLLLNTVEELNPGPQAPPFSKSWRRYRLMLLRYVEGHDPQATADQLAVSRRQFYREHTEALEAVSEILWSRLEQEKSADFQEQSDLSHLELLRLEATRLSQPTRVGDMGTILSESVELLTEMARRRNVTFNLSIPEDIPRVGVSRALLRQLMVGALSLLVENIHDAPIHIRVDDLEEKITIVFNVVCPSETLNTVLETRQIELQELAGVVGVTVEPIITDNSCGLCLTFPTIELLTVLIVDDNQDVLALFQRYLTPHHYKVLTTQSGQEAYDIARKMYVDVILLDLMMPDQDGWDLLQMLLNQPETEGIPIIVCSVLKQKELALSLGASMFLEKPVTEQQLMATLEAIKKY